MRTHGTVNADILKEATFFAHLTFITLLAASKFTRIEYFLRAVLMDSWSVIFLGGQTESQQNSCDQRVLEYRTEQEGDWSGPRADHRSRGGKLPRNVTPAADGAPRCRFRASAAPVASAGALANLPAGCRSSLCRRPSPSDSNSRINEPTETQKELRALTDWGSRTVDRRRSPWVISRTDNRRRKSARLRIRRSSAEGVEDAPRERCSLFWLCRVSLSLLGSCLKVVVACDWQRVRWPRQQWARRASGVTRRQFSDYDFTQTLARFSGWSSFGVFDTERICSTVIQNSSDKPEVICLSNFLFYIEFARFFGAKEKPAR